MSAAQPGGHHYDVLLSRLAEPADPDQRVLMAWRIAAAVWKKGPFVREFEAERMPDHRAAYLEYEGEISGGRGTVRRVLTASCAIDEDGPSVVRIRVGVGPVVRSVVGTLVSGDRWRFVVA
ncbi:MAG: hypothetical protein IBJ11_00250 [Phycisphaerales bacterium]|nr:hypothetical protein [Phycisphaerales bacterium]